MTWHRADYPPDWDQVRARILTRAGDRCEATRADGTRCEVKNHTWLHRAIADPERAYECAAAGRDCTGRDVMELYPEKVREAPIYVRLTTAHAVGVPPSCGDLDQLSCLCELHHLRLDAALHAQHAAETRRQRRIAAGQLLLEVVP